MTDSSTTSEVVDDEAESAPLAALVGGIVVGMDGSTGALRALRWAVQEAKLRNVPVRAVTAWEQPAAYGSSTAYSLGMDPSAQTQVDLALAERVEATRLKAEDVAAPHQDVDITYQAIEGHAVEVLLTAAHDADLLVVGSRGHGGFRGALLGSVSQHVVQHARCPVTIIPELADLD